MKAVAHEMLLRTCSKSQVPCAMVCACEVVVCHVVGEDIYVARQGTK